MKQIYKGIAQGYSYFSVRKGGKILNNRKMKRISNLPQQKLGKIYYTQQRSFLEEFLPLKDKIKFCNVDLLAFMEQILQRHTKWYRSDFEIDKKMLWESTKQQEQQNCTFLWLCRMAGTWLLPERNILLRGTSENNTFNFYAEQKFDSILCFVVRITNVIKESLIGDMYILDYNEYHAHVCNVSICAETVLLQYEHGNRIEKADFIIKNYTDTEYGRLLSIQYHPQSQKELEELLKKEQQERNRFQEEDASSYIL